VCQKSKTPLLISDKKKHPSSQHNNKLEQFQKGKQTAWYCVILWKSTWSNSSIVPERREVLMNDLQYLWVTKHFHLSSTYWQYNLHITQTKHFSQQLEQKNRIQEKKEKREWKEDQRILDHDHVDSLFQHWGHKVHQWWEVKDVSMFLTTSDSNVYTNSKRTMNK
jgi:hypothetical protein